MSATDDSDDTAMYHVVKNREDQLSIWPASQVIPPGWQRVGKTGLRDDCLQYIAELWTDMPPLTLRRQMETFPRKPAS